MTKLFLRKFVERWEKVKQKDRLNYALTRGIFFSVVFTIVKDWSLIVEAINNNFELLKQVLQNSLKVFVWATVTFYFLIWWLIENIYLKFVPETERRNYDGWNAKQVNKSCKEIEMQNKTENQIRSEIASLIDNLNLGNYKEKLLSELRFNYRLKCFDQEDYSQLGNTRLGGLPDLPKNVEYPYYENGYYNLLCQINFSEFENKLGKLPEKGILYIFNGHSSDDDFFTYFSKSTDNLEKKYPPEGMKNLNEEYNKTYYDGLKVRFEVEHLFGDSRFDVYNFDKEKYQTLFESNSRFHTHILGNSMDSISSVYLHLKGFETLKYEIPLDIESRKFYQKQFEKCLNDCISETKKDYPVDYAEKREQLLKFNQEKEVHFKNYNKVTCLIGLESLDRLEWMWSDSGFKYVYILDEDLQNENFDNLLVETWSS
ncbi:MAG: DUF1963 domain-containing protein [Saprospiraceae bacterium]|nr:DUF1963 domain-containing protein [Saprospiraceae bacterium]